MKKEFYATIPQNSPGYQVVYFENKHIATLWSGGLSKSAEESRKMADTNAKIVADALNTTMKCNKLPSELLAQRNELLEALKELTDWCSDLSDWAGGTSLDPDIEKCRKAIQKATE